MPFIVIALFTWFMWAVTSVEDTASNAQDHYAAKVRRARTEGLAEAINQYINETGSSPATLAALVSQPGYTHTRQYQPDSGPHSNGPYYYTASITDAAGTTYNRVVAYLPPQDNSLTATTYLDAANNTCGGTAPNTDNPWCGNTSGIYWHRDTRDQMDAQLVEERTQQITTLKKFAAHYSKNQSYPDPGTGLNTAVTLISRLTGYGLTATTCAGIWNWSGIPLGCEDLYTRWGTPRVYNYIATKWIALYAEAPYYESGQPIAIATQHDNR